MASFRSPTAGPSIPGSRGTFPGTRRRFPGTGRSCGPGTRIGARPALLGILLSGILLSTPTPVLAQFGALEALASNVTDLSFFGGAGGMFPAPNALDPGSRTFNFGVELLFQIAAVERPVPGAVRPPAPDSVRLNWTRMEVVRNGEGVDTVFHYEVEEARRPPMPTDTVWTVELGIGYGQVSGFDLADPALALRGSIRDLPAATVYASYEPWSTYFGLRTGFMRTKSLQVIDQGSGDTFGGSSEAFLLGGLLGYAWSIGDFWAFAETAYTLRYFPSVEWATGSLPDGVPADLRLSGWTLTTGIQFPIR